MFWRMVQMTELLLFEEILALGNFAGIPSKGVWKSVGMSVQNIVAGPTLFCLGNTTDFVWMILIVIVTDQPWCEMFTYTCNRWV